MRNVALILAFCPRPFQQIKPSISGQLCLSIKTSENVCVMNCHHAVKLFFSAVVNILLLWPYCFYWLLLIM